MFKNFKQLAAYASLVAIFAITVIMSAHTTAYDPLNNACSGASDNAAICSAKGTTTNPIAGSGGLIQKAAILIGVVAGIGAVVMLVLGGLAFITSGGSPDKLTKAKARVAGSLIGFFIVLMAWAIVKYVEDKIIR